MAVSFRNPYSTTRRGSSSPWGQRKLFLLIFACIICIWTLAIVTYLRKNPELEKEFTSDIQQEEKIIVNKISRGRIRARKWLLRHQEEEDDEVKDNTVVRHKWELTQSEDRDLLLGPDNTPIHLVFSTDCGDYQHWQSYQLFLSALRVRQPGRVTRIASGCSDDEKSSIKRWHDEHVAILSSRFGLHLTPHFSSVKDENGKTVGDYEFFNKPFGLLHWMEHGEYMGVDPDTNQPFRHDTIIILLDPDEMLMRPITQYFHSSDTIFRGGGRPKYTENESSLFVVRHGHPLSQEFGFGASWLEFAKVAGEDSPAGRVSKKEATSHYAAGPPYIGTALDMHAIASKWCEFVPKVHAEFPELMAEMYAFSIASAHLELPHQLVGSLMISDASIDDGEGWKFIDDLPAMDICDFAMNGMDTNSQHTMPSVLHFCQRYGVGDKNFFAKKKVPTDFFSCESPLLEEPAMDIGSGKYLYRKPPFLETTVKFSATIEKREAFVICRMTGFLNEAALFYKSKHCNGSEDKINIKKEINLHDLPE